MCKIFELKFDMKCLCKLLTKLVTNEIFMVLRKTK